MSLEWEQIVVDATQPAALGRWGANALGGVVTFEADDEFEIRLGPENTPEAIRDQLPLIDKLDVSEYHEPSSLEDEMAIIAKALAQAS